MVELFDLRGFSRVVIAAGDPDYCHASIAAAEAVRDPLLERGVLADHPRGAARRAAWVKKRATQLC